MFYGNTLMDRFISVKRGFTLFSRLGYVEKGLDLWYKVRSTAQPLLCLGLGMQPGEDLMMGLRLPFAQDINTLYVYFVEERLAEALTSYQQTGEGEFVRRTNTRCACVWYGREGRWGLYQHEVHGVRGMGEGGYWDQYGVGVERECAGRTNIMCVCVCVCVCVCARVCVG